MSQALFASCVALLALAACTLAQTQPHRINRNDENCGGEEVKMPIFETPQISWLRRCQQLSRNDCLFLLEAESKCPCICERRRAFYNALGVGRDIVPGATPNPEFLPRPTIDFKNNEFFNWPDPPPGYKAEERRRSFLNLRRTNK